MCKNKFCSLIPNTDQNMTIVDKLFEAEEPDDNLTLSDLSQVD
jgi:hypothetical protein